MTERELIIGLKRSSVSAYRQLFMDYWSIIRRFLSRMLGDNIQAEDIAQNIFIKVWINRAKLDENKSIKTYLYVLAKNEAINHIKHESRMTAISNASAEPSSQETQDTVYYREVNDLIRKRVEVMPPLRRRPGCIY